MRHDPVVVCGRTALLALLLSACAGSPGPQAPYSVTLPTAAKMQEDWRTPPAAYVSERNRCIDHQLAVRKLNPFGDPEGTTYRGGSPTLSLAKGMDRYDYVMRHRRDIATACTRAPHEQSW